MKQDGPVGGDDHKLRGLAFEIFVLDEEDDLAASPGDPSKVSDARVGVSSVPTQVDLGSVWKVDELDLRRRRIKVVETVLNIGYEITEGTPKTARGRRTVAIDAATVEALRAHRRKQTIERAAAGSEWTDLDLVFTRADGTFVHPDIYSQTFRRAVRRLGLPYIRLHDLRHTHATLGLEAGIPVKVMSTRLGHATTAFTQDVYMHSVPSLEDSAADQIADLIFGERLDDEPD